MTTHKMIGVEGACGYIFTMLLYTWMKSFKEVFLGAYNLKCQVKIACV